MSNETKPGFWPWNVPAEPQTSGEWMNFVDGWLAARRGEPNDPLQSPFWLSGWEAADRLELSRDNAQTSYAMS